MDGEEEEVKRPLKFGIPSKTEAFLLFLAGITLFYLDVSQNKVLDLGLFYKTSYFGDIKTFALINFWLGLFIYFVLLVSIILLSVRNRDTHYTWDLVAGGVAILGISFLVGGFLAEFARLSDPSFLVPFIHPAWQLIPTSFYHIGIAIQLLTTGYFTLTK